MSSRQEKILLLAILVFSALLRFGGLNWGDGYFFHPDENNMARAILNLSQGNSPGLYAYGQYPLFIALFSARIYNLFSFVHQQHQLTFSQAVFFLRFWSALTGVAVVWLVYLLGRNLIEARSGLIAAATTAFLPGLIQASHFGTTESWLTLFYLTMVYFSFLFYQENKRVYLFSIGLLLGLALATKISAAIFIFVPLTAIGLVVKNDKKSIKDNLIGFFLLIIIALIVMLLFSPFLVINYQQSLAVLRYEIAIARGSLPIFYTRQFFNTQPFLFQIKKVLPFLLGWPILVLAPLAIISIIKISKRRNKKNYFFSWLIVLLPSLIFFIYQGQLFVKWTRFMVPILPVFSLLFAQTITSFYKPLQYILIVSSFLPGLFLFDLVYGQPDVRQQFSSWAKKNLPENSIVLFEENNVVDLPLGKHSFQTISFNFYRLEEEDFQNQLSQLLELSDYLLIPSRRVFANHSSAKFPNTANFYQKLFSEQLGFLELKKFNPTSRLWLANLYYAEAEKRAEETWTVFDHPTIRIYQKKKPYSAEEYRQILF